MEGFSPLDIFATKGVEYLLVIGYLIVLVAFWKLINRSSFGAPSREEHARPVSSWFKLADGFFFHQGHSWAVPESGDVVKVGVDDFAQRLLGEPGSIKLPEIGSRVEQGRAAWSFEIDSKLIGMLSPVDGEVVSVNQEVLDSPVLVCDEPYGKGWLMKVKVPQIKSNLRNLISGKLASAWLDEAVARLRLSMAGDLGPVLQDGGMPMAGFVKNLSPENWDEIAREFFLVD